MSDAKELQKKGGWLGESLANSPYNPLKGTNVQARVYVSSLSLFVAKPGKWIYFFGDSTLRQLWVSYAAPFQGNNFERNAKEWTRHYCAPQTTGTDRTS